MNQERQKYTLFVKFIHKSYRVSPFIKSSLGMNNSATFSTVDGAESRVEFSEQESESSSNYKFLMKIETLFRENINQKRFDVIKDYEVNDKPIPTKGQWATTVGQTCPATLAELINTRLKSWQSPGERLLNLMSWRSGVLPTKSDLYESLSFSLDNNKWVKVEHTNFYLSIISYKSSDTDLTTHIQELLDNDVRQPLAMDLLDEAFLVMYTNERSAFVLAATALEVGVKELIKSLKPEAGNMLLNSQSPPVEFLVNHYIPEIVKEFKPSGNLMTKIKNIVNDRNKLVHKGDYTINHLELKERLNTIRALLYLFSSFQGHEWARSFIDEKKLL